MLRVVSEGSKRKGGYERKEEGQRDGATNTSVWKDFRLDSKPGLVEQIAKNLAMAVDS